MDTSPPLPVGRQPENQRRSLFARNVAPPVVVAIVMLALVGVPTAVLLFSAFKPSTRLPFDAVPLTLQNMASVFGNGLTYQLLGRTLLYGAGTIALGLMLAFSAAWIVERTTIRGRESIRALMVLVMGLPGILLAFAWLLLASPRSGVINLWLRQSFGATGGAGPFDVYSLWGLIFVTGIAVTPSSFFLICVSLRRLDARMEEAAATSGAAPAAVLRRIVAPLLSPGLLSVTLYLFVVLIQYFEVPLAIGVPGNVMVLSTRIYLLARPNPGLPEYGLASAFGCLTLIVAIALMSVYLRATRETDRYQTVTGKGYNAARRAVGPWTVTALVVVVAYFLLALVLPVAILLWASFLPAYQPPSGIALHLVSLQSYRNAFATTGFGHAVLNTLVIVLVTATATVIWSIVMAIVSVRSRMRWARLLEIAGFLPAALPAVVVALTIMLLSVRTPLYGTIWAIVVGQFIVFTAFSSRTITTALLQLHTELEEAAVMSGATWLQTQRRVVLPLLLPAAANAWVWVATHSLRDFTFPIILATTGNVVLSSLIWQRWSTSDQSLAAAMSIMLVIVLTGGVTVSRRALLHVSEG